VSLTDIGEVGDVSIGDLHTSLAISSDSDGERGKLRRNSDLLIDTTDCLDLAALIDRTSDCEALLDWRLGQGREQREQLGGRRAVAIDPTIGLLEDEACIERERPGSAKAATQKSAEDQDLL
jgi:hypothetical protein